MSHAFGLIAVGLLEFADDLDAHNALARMAAKNMMVDNANFTMECLNAKCFIARKKLFLQLLHNMPNPN